MSYKNTGFTLVELLIVIAIIGLTLSVGYNAYYNQYKKGNDAKRKKDLNQLRTILEDYYNDKNSYPNTLPCGSSAYAPSIKEVPCEPDGSDYLIQTDSVTYYKIYTRLENKDDPAIDQVGCDFVLGCPNAPNPTYNYGIHSGNVDL